MTRLARLPANDGAAEGASTRPRRLRRLRTRYYAFLSYSHKDRQLADWLHRELERFRVPTALAGKLTANGVVPRRLTPIFRDQHDLAAGDDLAEEIEAALAASQFLLVLCSPTAAKSRWTNLEIESFKRTRPEGCVLAAVVAGEPFATDMPGREEEECFPPALRFKYDRRGHRTTKRAEPLAADFRDVGDGKRLAFLKLVAGMLGIGLDELVQRDSVRRYRRLGWLAAASIAGMAVTSTLAVTAIQARDAARDQRREAEGLIGFMLGDLKDKLEPIGRLDALDGVGSRVLAYYQKQGTTDLSDASLSQRSRALSLMAEVANLRGDVDGSLRLYREASAGTAEAIRRNPDDPQALFDHAQNVFYIGQIAEVRGDNRGAERMYRQYKALAEAMVRLQPDNMKWRMEEQYADADLGIVLHHQRRFAEAAAQFSEALKTIEAISTADPSNQDYRKYLAESLAWVADNERALGHYDAALAARQRDVAILQQLFAQSGDVSDRQRLVQALRGLGNLYADQGQRDLAIAQFRSAASHAEALTAVEPSNTQWLEYRYNARLDLAKQLLASGQQAEAEAHARLICQTVNQLLARDSRNPGWREGLTRCLALRTHLALDSGAREQALDLAQRTVATAQSVHTGDPVADRFLVAKSYRLVGDVQRALGNADAARAAWTSALAAIPAKVVEEPGEVAQHAIVLARLGRQNEARALDERLKDMGYKNVAG